MPTTDDQDDANEIVAAIRAAKKQREAASATPEPAKARKWPIATIGLGVGSAAVVAALLYANRNRRN